MRRLSLISYIGGKYYLVNWIISLLPKGTVYVEPFGGGASVLLNKPRHQVEVYNDINEKLVNLFRCIQDDIAFQKLYHRLYWTPASLSEFLKSIEILKSPTDPIDTAWAVFVFMNQVFSGKFEYTKGNWRRARSKNIGLEFQNKISRLPLIKNRLKNVLILNQNALDIIQAYDSEFTVFYLDPPYPLNVRNSNSVRYEKEFFEHDQLINLLSKIKGKFALSSYNNSIYENLLNIPNVHKYVRETSLNASTTKIKNKSQEVLYVKH